MRDAIEVQIETRLVGMARLQRLANREVPPEQVAEAARRLRLYLRMRGARRFKDSGLRLDLQSREENGATVWEIVSNAPAEPPPGFPAPPAPQALDFPPVRPGPDPDCELCRGEL